jgi:PKD repeat protein
LAYFVAQPKIGSSPLWVWFTDMSIAGSAWNWNFADNSGSTNRSPHHTFVSPGTYPVSQQINGASNYTQPVIVGGPSVIKGKSLGHLLLLLRN